ncbi:MAG: transcription antitermination factor NusB [Paracoccaceae bacterium]
MSAQPPGLAARRAALSLLHAVQVEGQMLDEVAAPFARLEPAEKARALGLARGVLRDIGRLDAVLARYMDRRPEPATLDILRLAAWECLRDGVAAHAVVDSTVQLAQGTGRTRRMAGLVNAVARRVAADGPPPDWQHLPLQDLPKPLSGPLARSYGKQALADMMRVQAEAPPLDVSLKDPARAEEWAEKLGAEILTPTTLRLREWGQVSALAGFESGDWWVQDVAAAQPVRLAGDVAGLRVLDLCAAPGGKTLQLAAAGADVTALDNSEHRLLRLRENLARTGLSAKIVAADAQQWAPQVPFDLIVLDAPCSASGTIRRHPDLPFIKTMEDIRPLLELQAALLNRALGWLAPNGRLIYCTCSLLPAEGEAQITKLLAKRRKFPQIRPALPEGLEPGWMDEDGNLRLRPDYWAAKGGMDGFFAAVLQAGPAPHP